MTVSAADRTMIEELRTLSSSMKAGSTQAATALLPELFLTTQQRSDRSIRTLCLQIGRKCIRSDLVEACRIILDLLESHELLTKRNLDPVRSLLALQWVLLLLNEIDAEHACFQRIVTAEAVLLYCCTSSYAKPSIRRSAIHRVKHQLHTALEEQQPNKAVRIDAYLRILCDDPRSSVIAAPLLKLVLQSEGLKSIDGASKRLIEFYLRCFVGTKTLVERTLCKDISIILEQAVDLGQLETSLLPAINRALLRAPEIIASPIAVQFILDVVPNSTEATSMLAKELTKPLLGALKSSHESTRSAGSRALRVLLNRASKHSDAALNGTFDAYINDRLGTEQRLAVVECLVETPLTSKQAKGKIAPLIAAIKKESSVDIKIALIKMLYNAIEGVLVAESQLDDISIQIICSGLQDSKAALRNTWTTGLYSMLTRSENPLSGKLEMLLDVCLEQWSKDVTTGFPAQSLQGGHIASSLAGTSIILTFSRSPQFGIALDRV